jgi:hypothetical protein
VAEMPRLLQRKAVMAPSPVLTDGQKIRLAELEPRLRECVSRADFGKAKEIVHEVQTLLRSSGHEIRLLQAKNWLYETALEANQLDFAKSGFIGTIAKTSSKTRLHLEATALLAVCYLKEGDLDSAKPQIAKAVDSVGNIKSTSRRMQFHKRLLARFEEEALLAGMRDKTAKPLKLDEVDSEAIRLVSTATEDAIYDELGKAVPARAKFLLEEIYQNYVLRLPAPERKLLPPPIYEKETKELGKKALVALKRVAWRSLCSKDSEIYKAWNDGLSVVYDKKYIASSIVACFNSVNITVVMLAASAAALAIKFGAETFCELYAPRSLMIDRRDTDQN